MPVTAVGVRIMYSIKTPWYLAIYGKRTTFAPEKQKRSFVILIGGQNYRMPDKMTG